jgi:hypothetical protein
MAAPKAVSALMNDRSAAGEECSVRAKRAPCNQKDVGLAERLVPRQREGDRLFHRGDLFIPQANGAGYRDRQLKEALGIGAGFEACLFGSNDNVRERLTAFIGGDVASHEGCVEGDCWCHYRQLSPFRR